MGVRCDPMRFATIKRQHLAMWSKLSALPGDSDDGVAGLPATALVDVPVGIAVTSLAGSVLYANQTFRQLFDISGDAAASNDIGQLTRGLLSEEFLLPVAREGKQLQRRVSFDCSGGQRRLLCTAKRVMHGELPIYLTIAIQDISELAAGTGADSAQTARESLASTLLEYMEMPVMATDARCRYRYFNPAYAAMVNNSNGTMPRVGELVIDSIIDPERRRGIAEVLARVVRGERMVHESRFLDARGEVYRWIDFQCTPLVNESGTIEGAMLLGYDVTPLKRANLLHQHLNAELRRRLERRSAKIDAANRDLSNRVDMACESLRRDLNELRESLAADGSGSELPQQRLATLASMEAGIGALSRLASVGLRTPERVTVDMNRLVREICQDLTFLMEGRHIEFDVDRLPNAIGDRVLLRLVLHNLVSNAIVATRGRHPARIRIWTTIEEGTTIWSVADNGVGFDMKDADVMFSAFARHGLKQRGVGLSVAWRAIQQLNGRLWCQSSPGQGAMFHFILGHQDQAT
jgi:signal transduction histidine kinase